MNHDRQHSKQHYIILKLTNSEKIGLTDAKIHVLAKAEYMSKSLCNNGHLTINVGTGS